jgi:branched-subunit amino acid ABC-type transport system permease component
MSTIILFLILGLGSGAVYAALALGLVVTYRSSGVVNLATGAIALYVAYTYAFLRQGELVDPVPGLNPTPSIGTGPLGFWPSFGISIVIAGVLGALLYVLIFRPLRAAPAAAKAVASVGVMIVIEALLATGIGSSAVSVTPIFPYHVYEILGSRVPGDRLWFAALVIVVSIGLGLWFRLTRFGLATRAAAESEKGAFVTGLSPQRIALVNWALSTIIAGIGGVLIAPIVELTPDAYALFIVAALAAALVGNFTKIGVTVAAALVIGMLQSEATYLQSKSWLPSSGLSDLVPLIVILIFLVVRGQELPARGAIIAQTLGLAPRPRGYVGPAVIIAVAGFAALAATGGSMRAAIITTLVMAIIALSQVVVTGFSGQISFAQLTIAGVGAFSLTRIQFQLHVPFPFAPLLAAVFAMIVGVVVGLPALRIRGLPVAVTTLALAAVLQNLWFNNPDWNGGLSGSPIQDPSIFGVDLGVGSGRGYPHLSFGVLCLIVLLLAAGGVAVVRRSRLGAAMLAVRANERAAAASGISVSRIKLAAFAIGGFLAGLGGAMLAYQQTTADESSFTALGGLAFFTTAYLAGVTSISGGINAGIIAAGGIIYVLVNNGVPLWICVLLLGLLLVGVVQLVGPKFTRLALAVAGLAAVAAAIFHHGGIQLGSYYTAISGVLLILTVILNPEGIVGPMQSQLAALREKLRARRFPAKTVAPATDGLPAADGAEPAGHICPPPAGPPAADSLRGGRALRRRGRERGRELRGLPGRDRRPDRPERRGQDHLDRRDQRVRARHGLGRVARPQAGRTQAVPAQPERAGPDVPGHRALRRSQRPGECRSRHDGGALQPRGRGTPGLGHRRLLQDPGSAGRRRRPGTAAVGRPAPARVCRPRAGRAPGDRLAGRAGRRARRHREPLAGRAAARDPRRGDHHRHGRPRHGPRPGRVRPDHRAEPGPGYRRRPASRDRAQRRGQAGLPGHDARGRGVGDMTRQDNPSPPVGRCTAEVDR